MFVNLEKKTEQRLAEAMKIGRLHKDLSQEELAEFADISRNYVSNIERKIANPSFKILLRITKILDLDLNEIMK